MVCSISAKNYAKCEKQDAGYVWNFFIVFNRTLLMMIEQKGLFPRRGILAIVSTAGGSNQLFPLF